MQPASSVSTARSLYFSWVDKKLPYRELRRVGEAMLLLSSADRDALYRFHQCGDRSDRETEAQAAERLAEALATVSGRRSNGRSEADNAVGSLYAHPDGAVSVGG